MGGLRQVRASTRPATRHAAEDWKDRTHLATTRCYKGGNADWQGRLGRAMTTRRKDRPTTESARRSSGRQHDSTEAPAARISTRRTRACRRGTWERRMKCQPWRSPIQRDTVTQGKARQASNDETAVTHRLERSMTEHATNMTDSRFIRPVWLWLYVSVRFQAVNREGLIRGSLLALKRDC